MTPVSQSGNVSSILTGVIYGERQYLLTFTIPGKQTTTVQFHLSIAVTVHGLTGREL